MKLWMTLMIVLVLLIGVGAAGIYGFRYLVSPTSTDSTEVTVSIAKGESVGDIATDLEKKGLIRSALVYRIFVRLSGFETKIQAGDFKLAKNLAMKDLTYRLTRGTTDQVITTLEGWRIEEIAEYLEKKQVVSRDEFLEAAGSSNLDYDFLSTYQNLDQPYRRLEGYLFPDTYQISAQSSAESVIKKMLDNFSGRVTDEMKADSDKAGLKLSEVVNLASILEREVRHDGDRPTVAGILIKRFKTPGWRIQADATVQYALGTSEKWWPTLTASARDVKPDSPYNSYTHDGLPPTPIANPGLASIQAAIKPESSDYWYYVSGSDGLMHYAKTLDEQNANIQKYL